MGALLSTLIQDLIKEPLIESDPHRVKYNSNGKRASKPLPEKTSRLFDYNPKTGSIVWKTRPDSDFKHPGHARKWNETYSGTEAGYTTSKGYRVIGIDNQIYPAARIVVYLMTGKDTLNKVIYRVNGLRNDDRWENLKYEK